MKTLKLKQKLYKYSSLYLLEYEVFGILQREEGEYYQIECRSCRDHDSCEVLIKLDDHGRFKYISMLNEDEDADADEDNKQYHWHTTEDKDYYCLSKKESLEKVLNRNIELCREKIIKHKEIMKKSQQEIITYKEQLKGLEGEGD